MKINSKKINVLLAEERINQTKLAERSGILRQNVSTIIRRGTCDPKTAEKLAAALAAALGVSVREIACEEEEEEEEKVNFTKEKFCPLCGWCKGSNCAWWCKSSGKCAIAALTSLVSGGT